MTAAPRPNKPASDTGWENEAFLESIIQNIPHMIFVKDGKTLRFVRCNKAGEKLMGFSEEQLLGKSDADFFPAEQAAFFNEKDREVLKSGFVVDVPEEPLQTPEGTRYLHTKKIPILDAEGRPQFLLGISEDITERKRVEDSNNRFSRILESTPDLIAISDPHSGAVLYMNPAGRRMLGIALDADIAGRQISSFHPASSARKIFEEAIPVAVRDGSWSGETVFLREDGTELPVSQVIVAHRDASGELRNVSTIVRDISEIKKLNEQVLQAKKMDAAATLAGGTAHEFNNLHTTIMMAASIIKDQLKDNPDLSACVDEILTASERASVLTRRLLAFARQDRMARASTVNLNHLLEQEMKTIRSVLGPKIQLTTDLSADLYDVHVDPKDVSQIFFNLAENARDAMPDGGTVVIRTASINSELPGAGKKAEVRCYTRLTFTDSGKGMDEETKAHAFEPFFTTKGRASGTGLGLAAVYGIVKRAGGTVTVQSSVGHGTTFEINLPSVCSINAGPQGSRPS